MQVKKRKSIRLKGYDYSQSGIYFVTSCSFDRLEIFGSVKYDRVELSAAGEIVQEEWWVTEKLRKRVLLDEFIIMPNHIHGILAISGDIKTAGGRVAPASPVRSRLSPNSLGSIIGQFKSQCTKRIRKLLNKPNLSVWQRNYYEHIIRNDRELERIQKYIRLNPLSWHHDRYHSTVAIHRRP